MAPVTENKQTLEVTDVQINDNDWDDWKASFRHAWHSVADWVVGFFQGLNNETIAHPYLIAIALFVIAAWPHILLLPFWFGKDAYRRVEAQTRQAASVIASGRTRPRKRDAFIARYRSIVNATYDPPRPAFGGTPLTEGNFAIEEETELHIGLRIVRWSMMAWAVFILGREWYHHFFHS